MDSAPGLPAVDDLVAIRRSLLWAVLHPPAGLIGLVRTQELLLLEMARAETTRRSLSKKDPLRHELKWHQDQLRIVGDTIAWLALDPHAIRSFSKAPEAPPPSIAGQQEGMQAVLARALELAEAGSVVVLADATNVIRNGDIVSLQPDGSLLVTECKTSRSTHRSPRGQRQADRASKVSGYLRTGMAADPTLGVLTGPMRSQKNLVAVAISEEAQHSFDDLQATVQRAVEQGSAVSRCSDTEMILAGSDDVPLPDSLPMITPTSSDDRLLIGFSSDLVNSPSPLYPPVTLWDLPEDQRLLVWEKDLIVSHLVATSAFLGADPQDASIVIVGSEPDHSLKVRAGDTNVWLGSRLVGSVLYGCERPESARERGLEFARQMLATDDHLSLADPGPETRFDLHLPNEHS